MRVSQQTRQHRNRRRSVQLLDIAPAANVFLDEALDGLTAGDKSLPCKYLYDDLGSWLFDQICELPEYYLTRSELEITRQHAPEIAAACGLGAAFVELGAGNSHKTRALLHHLHAPAAYIPVDIARVHLLTAAESLAFEFPRLPIFPVVADFTRPLPPLELGADRTVVYLPGSTLGNFTDGEAVHLLRNLVKHVGDTGGVIVGIDHNSHPTTVERAYNDERGVTAAFHLNLLVRLNRELGADFDLTRFHHRARFDARTRRVETHLVSLCDQAVRVGPYILDFAEGEPIRTEYAHKYSHEHFSGLAAAAGLRVRQVWTDPAAQFSVQYLTPFAHPGDRLPA